MAQKRKMPKPKDIVRYWQENMPEHLDDGQIENQVCFACGWGDGKKAILYRSHITAKSDGGSDTVDNLHMLCGMCHTESETFNGEYYWQWYEKKFNNWDFGYNARKNVIDTIEAKIKDGTAQNSNSLFIRDVAMMVNRRLGNSNA